MRLAITILVILVVAVAGGIFALDRLIGPEDLRAQVLKEAEALTGQPLAIDGRVELKLLPRPTLSLGQARFTPARDGGPEVTLEVDRVDLGVKPLPLLRGEVRVENIRLVRPLLRVDVPPAPGEVGLDEVLDAVAALAPGAVSQISVIDGRAEIQGIGGLGTAPLERIDLELSARSERGPFFANGTFGLGDERLRLDLRLGRLTEDPSTTLQASLGGVDGTLAGFDVSYQGVVALDELTTLRGQLALRTADLAGLITGLGRPLGTTPTDVPAWLARPVTLEGLLDSKATAVELSELRLTVDGVAGRGRLTLARGPQPALDLELAMDEISIDDHGLPSAALDGALAALAGTAGRFDLSLDALEWRGEVVRRVRLTLASNDSGVVIEQARAVLPGHADVSFQGLVAAPGGALSGRLVAVTDRFGALMGWLAPGLPGEVTERLRAMSLAGDVSVDHGRIRVSGLDARLDAARIEGSLSYLQGARPQLAADLVVDRLSLDRYLPDLAPREALAAVGQELTTFDLELALELDRLTWQNLRLSEISLEGRVEDGRLELARMRANGFADASVELKGTVDARAERLELEGALDSPEPGRLLRRLGLAPAIVLGRLGSLEARGRLTGWTGAGDLDLSLRIGELEASGRGTIGLEDDGGAAYDLEVDAHHPHYDALLDQLGLGRLEPEDGPQDGSRPLSAAGTLRLAPDQAWSVSGHMALGATTLTGEISLARGPPRPQLAARLSLGDPKVRTLLPMARLAGLRIDPVVLGRRMPGAWPGQPIDLGLLGEVDARVMLSGKGGFAGQRLEVEAALADRHLTLSRGALELSDGTIGFNGSLDLRRPLPSWRLALTLEAVQAEPVIAALGVPVAFGGTVDLYGEASAAGDNAYDIARTLSGEVALSVRDGFVLLPAPGAADQSEPGDAGPIIRAEKVRLDLLEGQFDIDRGIASTTRLVLDTAAAPWRGQGVVDLLLWVIELTLENEAGARPRVGLVGPLDRPQVLIGEPTPAE